MDKAALVVWVITALGGSYLLATWLFRGGMRQRKIGATTFPASLIFGHFLLAAGGLGTWIAYLLTNIRGLAWAAVIALLFVATLGCTMFVRWGGETEQAAPGPVPSAPAPRDALPRPYPAPGASIAAAFGQGRGVARVPAAGAGRAATNGVNRDAAAGKKRTGTGAPAESHFPIAVVAGHGAFAVTTFVFVLLAALGVGK